MGSFSEALQEFYNGEVLGETAYSELLASTKNAEERLKWGTLLQLETETKAWLRAPMVAHGVSIEEKMAERQKALGLAEAFKPLSWMQQMQGLKDALLNQFVPAYQGFAEAARMRGNKEEQDLCNYMVEHEMAQVEFAQRELAGEAMDRTLAPIAKFLKYPLKR
jgi:hypothetical protein